MHRLKGFALRSRPSPAGLETSRRGIPDHRDGEEEAALRALAAERGVADKVVFIPWMARTDLLRTMASADAFLFPTTGTAGSRGRGGDGRGQAVIVSTRRPGITYRNRLGFESEPGEPRDGAGFADALIRCTGSALRQTLGQVARRRVMDFYMYDREGERMQEIYRFASDRPWIEEMTYATFCGAVWGGCSPVSTTPRPS